MRSEVTKRSRHATWVIGVLWVVVGGMSTAHSLTLAVNGTTGAPLGGIGCGAVKFCSHDGSFAGNLTTPAGSPYGSGISAMANTQFQLYTNRGGTIQTSQKLAAVLTNSLPDDDAIYPVQFANFGLVNGVQVKLTAFSPFDMAHLDRMCYPYVFYDISIVNTLSSRVDVACALQTSTSATPSNIPGKGFATASDCALYAHCSKSGAVVSAGSDNGFFTGGVCSNAPSGTVNRTAGKITLAPNDSARIGFVFAWFNPSDRYYYTNAAADASAFGDTGLVHFDEMKTTALELVTRMRASSVPGWFTDQLLNSLCNLTNNSIYSKDGRYCHAEGQFSIVGTMDQMWHARQINTMVVPYLTWQELEYWARTQENNPVGQIHHDFDTFVPWDDQQHADYRGIDNWVDLNCGFIISVYEVFIATNDQTRLNQLWPYVKSAGQRILTMANQYKTAGYPYMFSGTANSYDAGGAPDPFNGSLSIATYHVMKQLADVQGESALANRYAGIADTATTSFTKRYLTGKFPTRDHCESVLGGQWIGFFLKLGEFFPRSALDQALQALDQFYQPLTQGMGGQPGEWAPYLVSHLGGLCLQTQRVSRWAAMQYDWYKRCFVDRNAVFNQTLGVPNAAGSPNYSASWIGSPDQYISIPVSWRNYYDMVGFHRNVHSGELWIEPRLPDEMNHSMTNALIITPQGYVTVSCTESGSAFQNKHLVVVPDNATPVTTLYLRDCYGATVSATINGVSQTIARIGEGYGKELSIAWPNTIPVSGVTIDVAGDSSTDTAGAPVDSLIPIPRRSPYQRIEAESYDTALAPIQSEDCSDTDLGQDIGFVANNTDAVYDSCNFGGGASSCNIRVAATGGTGGTIELHLDGVTGPIIGTATVAVTGGWQSWATVSCPITGATGVRNLYLVFKGTGTYVCNVNWLQFIPLPTSIIGSPRRLHPEPVFTTTARGAKITLAGNEPYRVEIYTPDGKRAAVRQGNGSAQYTVGTAGASLPVRSGFYVIRIFKGDRSELHTCLVR